MQPDPENQQSPSADTPPQVEGSGMNVRIIPEDDENDYFILKPIFEAMFRHMGKPQADVKIHHPKVSGWEAVKKWENIPGNPREILHR